MSEKVSPIMTEELLDARAKRANKRSVKKILDKVPDRPPLKGDER